MPNYHRTEIEAKLGLVSGDTVMNTGGKGQASTAPRHVTRVAVDMITIGKRLRGTDKATVEKLYDDIRLHGLLQPIGLRQSKDDGSRYEVVYGVHRFLAFKKGWAEAERLIAERTDKDPEAYSMAYMFQSIPAIIYPSEMTNDYSQLKEITENLIRKGLTKDEKAVHEAKYTHLVKKLENVISAHEKRKLNASNQFKEGASQPENHPLTATEKATADLGISVAGLHRAHDQVNALAKAVARDMKLAPPKPITPESPPNQEAEHTLRLAEKGAQDKAKAIEAGEDPRKVHPIQPSPKSEITVRIDITDADQLLGWFRKQLADANKPLSLKYLRGLHKGLGKLIAESEVAK